MTAAFDCSADAVLDRLKDCLELATDMALAARLGSDRANLSKWRRRNSVPYDRIVTLCVSVGIDLDWILTGRASPWTPGVVQP